MIAEHLPEMIRLQKRFPTPVLYEAACCAGIPLPATVSGRLQYYASDNRYRYYIGKLSLEALAAGNWWKQDGVSLINISEIEEGEEDLLEKFESVIALRGDIFQPV